MRISRHCLSLLLAAALAPAAVGQETLGGPAGGGDPAGPTIVGLNPYLDPASTVVSLDGEPAGGTVTLLGDGFLVEPDLPGVPITFTYTAVDFNGGASANDQVTVNPGVGSMVAGLLMLGDEPAQLVQVQDPNGQLVRAEINFSGPGEEDARKTYKRLLEIVPDNVLKYLKGVEGRGVRHRCQEGQPVSVLREIRPERDRHGRHGSTPERP